MTWFFIFYGKKTITSNPISADLCSNWYQCHERWKKSLFYFALLSMIYLFSFWAFLSSNNWFFWCFLIEFWKFFIDQVFRFFLLFFYQVWKVFSRIDIYNFFHNFPISLGGFFHKNLTSNTYTLVKSHV